MVVSRSEFRKRKERAFNIVGALLLVVGGWAVFSLSKYGVTNLLLRFGVEGETYQYLFIILLVVLFFVLVMGFDKKSAFDKLLKL